VDDRTFKALPRVAALIAQADALLVTAGAGMTVDSGPPDSSGTRGSCRACPHMGYFMLLDWARAMPAGYFVVTSNVDGHFEQAGFHVERILEQNGNIIDDAAWVPEVMEAQQRRYQQWLASVRGKRLVIVELGAGKDSSTVRRIGDDLRAERSRTTLVRISPDAGEADASAIPIRMTALEALTRIEEQLPEPFRGASRAGVPVERSVDAGAQVETGVLERPTEAAWRAVPAGRFDYRAITLVDLDTGEIGPFNFLGIANADVKACLESWGGPTKQKFARLPDVCGHLQSGFLVTGGAVRSPESVVGRGAGAAVMHICGPDREAIMTLGVARRPLDGACLWRLLYEGGSTALKPLEYPRVPWVARRMDAAAAQHAAMLPVLAEVARVMAWTWFWLVECPDPRRRKGRDD